jgi:DNA replication and repair protein RecF
VRGRVRLTERLLPAAARHYAALAGRPVDVQAVYEAEWAEGAPADTDAVEDVLRSALAARRRAEIDRGLTLVGPHRDEWHLTIEGLEARHQSSQGEQRTLALALRLAGHEVVHTVTGTAPVLLLDDVFSELDVARASALVHELPVGQTLLTTAATVPAGVAPEQRLRIDGGRIEQVDA